MTTKLDLDRELFTLNGRPLQLIGRADDGRLVLQGIKSKALVLTDEFGRVDDKDYAVNRDRVKITSSVATALAVGQSVYAFRFTRKGETSLMRATFAGYGPKKQHCKLVPEQDVDGKAVLKVARQQIFESYSSLQQWVTRVGTEVERLGQV